MENMLQHTTCQSFETGRKKLIAMIKEPHAWPSFETELKRIETLQICFPDFNIIHVPRARNQISDFLDFDTLSLRLEFASSPCLAFAISLRKKILRL
ncbi:hypothetical protein DY000_02021783 [Brassica cretica]|uniref:RNase H type-1 domain-containing protein n=1 Tax=Brassica cretica TaxID=69181 RepID=A0ABQ7EKN0_BRACR|nr:hypothetical protein DY000_02021783 [Brassica cretica]